ncbi:MAG: 2-phospho-L-lactate transferase [Acidimicrobiales bacterium]
MTVDADTTDAPLVTALAGGVGAARFLAGLVRVHPPERIAVIGNTADDITIHGLHVSPDLDTVTYTLAGEINPDTGWGLTGESWAAMAGLRRYGGQTWFRLGDRDLGTHLYRSGRLAEGADLATVTAEIAAAWAIGVRLLPVTNDRLRTIVTVAGEGEIGFQEYFVERRHAVVVEAVRFDGAQGSKPAAGVLEAIAEAGVVVIAPSNPIVSIGPVLSVPGVADAVEARRPVTVAVSPIVAGAALKGPADRLLRELGHEPSVVGVARLYAPMAATLVIDEADSALAAAVEGEGMRCVVAPTIMSDAHAAATLARVVLDAVGSPS